MTPTPDGLRTLAGTFDREIGGVYGYVAAALRQQAHDRETPQPPAQRPNDKAC